VAEPGTLNKAGMGARIKKAQSGFNKAIMILNTPRLEDMDRQELDALHTELYVVMLSFQSMGISRIKHKFLREHVQDSMTDLQNLLKETDRIMDLMTGSDK
jgi:hypothetical protein